MCVAVAVAGAAVAVAVSVAVVCADRSLLSLVVYYCYGWCQSLETILLYAMTFKPAKYFVRSLNVCREIGCNLMSSSVVVWLLLFVLCCVVFVVLCFVSSVGFHFSFYRLISFHVPQKTAKQAQQREREREEREKRERETKTKTGPPPLLPTSSRAFLPLLYLSFSPLFRDSPPNP